MNEQERRLQTIKARSADPDVAWLISELEKAWVALREIGSMASDARQRIREAQRREGRQPTV